MKTYTIRYTGYGFEEYEITVTANSAAEAYDKAFYEAIPEKEGECPYSAWVYSVTYKSGKVHIFNTCEGLAY